ncbi:MAG: glycosyltransferase family 4 protein [Bacteroidales bacterium]|nr:glycosyltransferase family 4 protein [Bacteroidales bacterium]
MRILGLSSYYGSSVASSHLGRNRNQAFADAGFNMVSYAPTPSRGLTKEEIKKYKKIRLETNYDGHQVVHLYRMFSEGKNPVQRALRYTCSAFIQFFKGVFAKDARSCDVMFISSTPPIQGAMAALVKKCRRDHIPLIYNLQDIFPDSLVGTGLAKKGGFLWKIGRVIENFTYRNADKIIVISEDFKKNIMAKGVPEEKIGVIYNWVDADAVQPVAKDKNPLFDEFNLDKAKFTVVYAGNLGNAQNISIILEAAKKLPEIQFALFGTGGLEDTIRGRIAFEGLNNVHLNPLQPIERVSQVYSLGDVCVVSCKAGLGGSAMPSKTWTIMSCGRPVLASFDEGELKSIIENNDCGLFTHAGIVTEFVEAIKTLSNDLERCERMGTNARQFILENLTKEVGTKKYVEVLRSFETK